MGNGAVKTEGGKKALHNGEPKKEKNVKVALAFFVRASSYLEDVGEVSEVEDVVELDSGWEEGGGHTLVESQSQPDQSGAALLEGGAEALATHMLRQDGGVNGAQGLIAREGQGEDGEVALKEDRREFCSRLKVKDVLTSGEEPPPLGLECVFEFKPL